MNRFASTEIEGQMMRRSGLLFDHENKQIGGAMQMNEPAIHHFGAVLSAGDAAAVRQALLIASHPAAAAPVGASHCADEEASARSACSVLAEIVGSAREASVAGFVAWVPSGEPTHDPRHQGGSLTSHGARASELLGQALGLAWTKGALREGRLPAHAEALARLRNADGCADVDAEIARIQAEDDAMRRALARLLKAL